MFDKMKSKLSKAIKGREQSDEFINPKYKKEEGVKVTDFLKFRAPINGDDVGFAIQDDCKCSAVAEFLKVASAENIVLVKGPKTGMVLGVSGEAIPGFYPYHRP